MEELCFVRDLLNKYIKLKLSADMSDSVKMYSGYVESENENQN